MIRISAKQGGNGLCLSLLVTLLITVLMPIPVQAKSLSPVRGAMASVVNIRAPFSHQQASASSMTPKEALSRDGSGVIMDKQGYILTNYHIVKDASMYFVTLLDQRIAKARLVGVDVDTDLAVLKIDLPRLLPIKIADSRRVKLGESVYVVGNAYGLGHSLSSGIVSALNRTAVGVNQIETYIQTDAAINPGNSGGALLNGQGGLIGINSAIYSSGGGSTGVGFAIPSRAVQAIYSQLVQRGFVKHGWLGLEIITVTYDFAEKQGLAFRRGVYVVGLRGKDYMGLLGKILPGDVITQLDHFPVASVRGFVSYLAQVRPGSRVTVHLFRQNQVREVKVKVVGRAATVSHSPVDLPLAHPAISDYLPDAR